MVGDGVGIARWGTYLPAWRLDRSTIGAAWRGKALPGRRSVKGRDEDSVTLGVEAALACMDGAEDQVDAIFFATTSSPHWERHGASIIAGVLGRSEVATTDISGTLRAGTTALRAGIAAVRSGAAGTALVVAADARPAEPSSVMEQFFGDGAGAVLVSREAPVPVLAEVSRAESTPGPWRRSQDKFVRSFDPRVEVRYGYVAALGETIRQALAEAGVRWEDVGGVAVSVPEPGSSQRLASVLGVAVVDELTPRVGYLGAAHPIVALAHALETADVGSRLVVASHGEGADCVVLGVAAGPAAGRPRRTVAGQLQEGMCLPDYDTYLGFRGILDASPDEPRTSPVTYWRDRHQALGLVGTRCGGCGTVQFPANRTCVECRSGGSMEPVGLGRRGHVFTFTLDHLVGGNYYEEPVARLVVDIDSGGRLFLEMTDGDPGQVRVGDEVELTLRRLHDGAGFATYYWKARPARSATVTSPLAPVG